MKQKEIYTLSIKEQAIQIINQQPDSSTFDDLIRELTFAHIIEHGLKDIKNGNIIDNNKIEKIIAQWQK